MASRFPQVLVEYDPAEVDRFIEVADAIEDAFPGIMVDGVEVRGGAAQDAQQHSLPSLPFLYRAPCAPYCVPHRTARLQPPKRGTPNPPAACLVHRQVEGRALAFDIRLEDGTLVFSRAGGQEVPSNDELLGFLARVGVRRPS